jgi:putative nucleotidyltransferase with HDIG domain
MKRYDEYTTTHALNVSVLSMALAESLGLSPREVRSFGTAGLLHDLGKVTIPEDVLNKPGKLSDAERSLMNSHTVEGARIILEGEERMDMAAVVAYEHHIRLNGEGYPSLRYKRRCHRASDLVHVCDVFDALRTRRPYREAWEEPRVLDYIEVGAGSEFDPEVVRAFLGMMRTWSDRVAAVTQPSPDGTTSNGDARH